MQSNVEAGGGDRVCPAAAFPESESERAAESVTITEPAILVRVNRLYRDGISAEELYEATRGRWKVGPKRNKPILALAVFKGIVREVYQIDEWHLAGTTPQVVRVHPDSAPADRWEFVGSIAPADIRGAYLGGSVASYLKRSHYPILYVNC